MNSVLQTTGSLQALVSNAAKALAAATTHAEILEASAMSDTAYSAAKAAARFAKATKAHDELIMASHRAQADALEIQAQAKRRLADEYDAAQERGELRTKANNKLLPVQEEAGALFEEDTPEAVGVADIGLTHKQIHEARQIRDAEEADPGIVRRTLDEQLEAGEEPTKAALRKVVEDAAMKALRGGQKRTSNKNPHYVAPTQAQAAWEKLYGNCRSMQEWATVESLKLAMQGVEGSGYDQSKNIAAVRKWAETLNQIVGKLDA